MQPSLQYVLKFAETDSQYASLFFESTTICAMTETELMAMDVRANVQWNLASRVPEEMRLGTILAMRPVVMEEISLASRHAMMEIPEQGTDATTRLVM